MTKREVLTKAVTMDCWSDEEREILNKMIDGLNRKSSKPSKSQIANIGVSNDILAAMAGAEPMTAREIAEAVGITTNKASALLRNIVGDGKATKIPGAKSKDAPKYVAETEAEPYPVPSAE